MDFSSRLLETLSKLDGCGIDDKVHDSIQGMEKPRRCVALRGRFVHNIGSSDTIVEPYHGTRVLWFGNVEPNIHRNRVEPQPRLFGFPRGLPLIFRGDLRK